MTTSRPKVLDELIQYHSESNPERIAIRYKNESISYSFGVRPLFFQAIFALSVDMAVFKI